MNERTIDALVALNELMTEGRDWLEVLNARYQVALEMDNKHRNSRGEIPQGANSTVLAELISEQEAEIAMLEEEEVELLEGLSDYDMDELIRDLPHRVGD